MLFCELLSEVSLWSVGCTKEERGVVYALNSSQNLQQWEKKRSIAWGNELTN